MRKFGECPEEQATLEEIKYLRSQRLTYLQIAHNLNSQKVPTKCGRIWIPELVRNVLCGEAHTR